MMRTRLRTTTAAVASFLAAVAASADTYPRQPGVDAVHYVFRLAVGDTSDEISGEATVTLRIAAAVNEVFLDLASAADGKGMAVSAVTMAGKPLGFRHDSDRLRI